MRVCAIAACAANRVIGTGGPEGGIPWDLPRDRAHFREHTNGQHLLLGRRTFLEMAGWFKPGQSPHVLTRDKAFSHPAAASVSRGVPAAIEAASASGAEVLLVCGGASVYHAALPFTDEVLLTFIDTPVQGTACFPELPESEWLLSDTEPHLPDEKNVHPLEFRHYLRRP